MEILVHPGVDDLFSPPSSLVQQAARGENFSRASMALLHPSSTFEMSPGA